MSGNGPLARLFFGDALFELLQVVLDFLLDFAVRLGGGLCLAFGRLDRFELGSDLFEGFRQTRGRKIATPDPQKH